MGNIRSVYAELLSQRELDWILTSFAIQSFRPNVVNKQIFNFDDDGKKAADDGKKDIEPSLAVGCQQSRTSHEESSKAKRKPSCGE